MRSGYQSKRSTKKNAFELPNKGVRQGLLIGPTFPGSVLRCRFSYLAPQDHIAIPVGSHSSSRVLAFTLANGGELVNSYLLNLANKGHQERLAPTADFSRVFVQVSSLQSFIPLCSRLRSASLWGRGLQMFPVSLRTACCFNLGRRPPNRPY